MNGQASPLLHLQAAACAVPSENTLEAEIAHLRLEAVRGAYVAEALVQPVVAGLRADLAGLLGTDADGVALVEGATAARTALLSAWPLPGRDTGGTVGVAPSDWGPNVEAFAARGLRPVTLPVDGAGLLDLDGLELLLTERPPDLVHLTHVAAHRGLVQPVAAALERCRAHGVPLWVDAAQAIGHVDTSYGADATYAPGRKWLRGPRGVGVLAVAEQHREALRPLRTSDLADLPVVRVMEAGENHAAGRVGLARAVKDLLEAGPTDVFARLADRGAALREAFADLSGWALVDAPGSAAIVALRPTAGQDVVEVQRTLLDDHAILTTAGLPWRAPGDMAEPLLRLAPHVEVTDQDVQRVLEVLSTPWTG
jgi:pyridoxal 5-phosphate dependent beta-lyase